MTWYLNDEILDDLSIIDPSIFCFIYKITNLLDGRMYIGKKLFYGHKYSTKKGKRKKIKIESDWRDYWSSSAELKADVERLGKENFKREIIQLCQNKGTANYIEARIQMDLRVLESDQYYNSIINCRVHRKHIKL